MNNSETKIEHQQQMKQKKYYIPKFNNIYLYNITYYRNQFYNYNAQLYIIIKITRLLYLHSKQLLLFPKT